MTQNSFSDVKTESKNELIQMITDITLPGGDWLNLYTATGLSVGSALLIYNKTPSETMLWESPTKPSTAFVGGVVAMPHVPMVVTSGSAGAWVKALSETKLCVQAYTP